MLHKNEDNGHDKNNNDCFTYKILQMTMIYL